MSAAAAAADKAAQKLAEKKAKLAAKSIKAPPPPVTALRKLAVFADAPEALLKALEGLASGEVLERDVLYLGTDAASRPEPMLHFVVAGQVGVGEGNRDNAIAASKKKAKAEVLKEVGRTLAVFGAGDFFADDITAVAGGLLSTPSPRRRSSRCPRGPRARRSTNTPRWPKRCAARPNAGRRVLRRSRPPAARRFLIST